MIQGGETMKSIKTSLLVLTLLGFISTPAFARVANGKTVEGKTFIEGSTITLKGKKLSTESNPLKVEIVTVSDQSFDITDDSKLNKKQGTLKVKLPRVSADSKCQPPFFHKNVKKHRISDLKVTKSIY